jgi:hypothetical protein
MIRKTSSTQLSPLEISRRLQLLSELLTWLVP